MENEKQEILQNTYFKSRSILDIAKLLRRAIASDNKTAIRYFLKNNFDVNLTDNLGYTCLHTAVCYRSLNSLQYLLSLSQSEINIRNISGETPLLQTLRSNADLSIIKCLLEYKCDVTIPNYEGETPLHVAAQRGNEDIVHLLIANGADVNAHNNRGLTPLHEAVMYENLETVHILLYYNASVNEQAICDLCTPMHLTLKWANSEIAELLFDYVDDFSLENEEGETPFCIAVTNGMNIAVAIVEKGGDLYEVDKTTKLPLIFSKLNDKELFEELWSKVNVIELFARCTTSFLLYFLSDPFHFTNKEKLDILEEVLETIEYYDISYITEVYKLVYQLCDSKEERLSWTWILLSYGVPIGIYDIEYLFKTYHFCPEMNAILSSESTIRGISRYAFVQQIIYNCFEPQVLHRGIQWRAEYVSIIREFRLTYSTSESEIPSLQQLCRDFIRETIFKKYQKGACYKAYNAIMGLHVPEIAKEVLLLKRPIYRRNSI